MEDSEGFYSCEDEDDNMDVYEEEVEEPEVLSMEPASGEGSQLKTSSQVAKVLSPQNISSYMMERIKEVNGVLQESPTKIRLLLNHFKWDKDKLLESYFEEVEEAGDSLKKGPVSPKHYIVSKLKTISSQEPCEICFTCPEESESSIFGLDCGHSFCKECWISYLDTEIEGNKAWIGCPGHGCSTLIEDEAVEWLLKDDDNSTNSKLISKYKQIISNNFVGSHKQMRWCPSSTSCSNAVLLLESAIKGQNTEVECGCGFKFCFGCATSLGHHKPIKCTVLKAWLKKCADDSETYNWLNVNTKDCPKCGVPIEKNGGCNHMSCKNVSCQHHFCWICLGPFADYNHGCNRYSGEEEGEEIKKLESRTSLERYLFYYHRYVGHERSLALEDKLVASIAEKMAEIQATEGGMSWFDMQFLNQALLILRQCRQTLMITYGFAYYLDKTNEKYIFEDNQNDLEMATERLSALLEQDLMDCNICTMKLKVQDTFKYCENRREVLIAHVEEGYENGSWVYNTKF